MFRIKKRFPGKSGFTLIELLVVIAIISLLVSILIPSLQNARELARFTVCSTRVRGIGLGFALYMQDFDELPSFCMGPVYPNDYNYKHVLAPYLGICSLQDAIDPAKNLTPLRALKEGSPYDMYLCPSGVMAEGPAGEAATSYYFQNCLWTFVWQEIIRLGMPSWTRYCAPLAKFEHPSRAMLLYDNWQYWVGGMLGNPWWGTKPYNAHSLGEEPHGRNVLYVDGHVDFLGAENDTLWDFNLGGPADYWPDQKLLYAY